ncbi:GntR family histidine utilization transcriptional repressor [Brevundimonas vesicularis]|uniref:Histidine utilization repressor n=1 Tax=Brevundimonas vesicularis TaxID=41276 RepID=A0A7W9FSR5_BREVE|nr:histidine utilization repressor [Brevundimonas vesicularis]MBB5770781.1 GntR family histidine utilization transcriptional repressor [Brevundimonas vesicularis]
MSLHRRIYADLEGLILSGELSPGDRIPFEHELTERYGCSRMTVSKAISELAGRGLVTRRRRAGTFVAQPKAHAAVLAIPDLRAEVIERGQTYGYVLLNRIEREPEGEEEIELASGGLLLDLTCLHSADNAPLALEHRLIALGAAPQAINVDFHTVPPGSWLLDSAPWTEAENRISAIAADARAARLLELKPGAACLCVERRTWRDGQGVTRVWQTFPGDRYDLVARFSSAHSPVLAKEPRR